MQFDAIISQLRALALQLEACKHEMYIPSPTGEIKRLCDFYAVATVDELVMAQAAHVERLQSTLGNPKELARKRLREMTEDMRANQRSTQ